MLIVAAALGAALVTGIVAWRIAAGSVARMERRLAQEREQFEALAIEDPLTGLPNKRGFHERIDAELRRATREYYPVAVVVVDLDRFKEINDTWGHAVGDEALVKFSEHVRAELRAGDFAGRMGGDEFTLALVRADARSGERVLERLREALGRVTVGPAGERIGFSAGIAEFPRHALTGRELIERADSALYWGKHEGRGRTVTFRPERGESLSGQQSQEAVRRRGLLSTLTALAKAVDQKSRWTTGHSERVAQYAVAIAQSLDMDDDRVDAIRQTALLHDVGKIGVREDILTKDAPLDLQELDEMEHHSELGRAMLAGAGLPEQARWVFYLHERFDGSGYPSGLAGREIPVESRILHAADALDVATRPNAMRHHRPLREALAELTWSAGSRIDPEVAARTIDLVESGKLRIPGHELSQARPRLTTPPQARPDPIP